MVAKDSSDKDKGGNLAGGSLLDGAPSGHPHRPLAKLNFKSQRRVSRDQSSRSLASKCRRHQLELNCLASQGFEDCFLLYAIHFTIRIRGRNLVTGS